MKSTCLLLLLALGALAAQAQAIHTADVPPAVRAALERHFAGAKAVEWSQEGGGYEAEFKLRGAEVEAVFSREGTLLETETEIAVGKLPAAIRTTLKLNFPAYRLDEAARLERAGKTYYVVEAEAGDTETEFTFLPDGTLIAQETETDDDADKDEGSDPR